MKEILRMSRKETERIKVICQIIDRRLTVCEAAEILKVSERHLYRILLRYREEGEKGLIHRLRGRKSNRGYGKEVKEKVIELYRKQYSDYGASLYTEMLMEYHKMKIDHETVRRWMREKAITTSFRKKRPHRRRRERRAAIGELIQFDGSPHYWFEDRGTECCLLSAIDDATNKEFIRLVPSENTEDVLRVLWDYVKDNGIPKTLYTDRGSVFYAEEKLTDVGRAMEQLGVGMIFAHSPQAKGRVERENRTHQDRLVKALRREGISTIAEANRYIKDYYQREHNRKFSIADESLPDVHCSTEGYDLKNIFCYQTERQLRNDYTITLGGVYIQLLTGGNPLPYPRQTVTVRKHLDGSLHIFFRDKELPFELLDGKPKNRPRVILKPKADHPWRNWNIGRGKYLNRKVYQ